MKLGIIAAMDEEITRLKEKLCTQKQHKVMQQSFFSGTLENHETILLQCGVGKVNAAVGTAMLNHLFNPDYIINIGCAGGLDSSLNVGDIIISSEVRYHDVDLTIFGYEFGQMAQMPVSYFPDAELVNIAKAYATKTPRSVKTGLIVSGDSFVSSQQQIDHIRNKFIEICAVEMEACAIAHACHLFNKPFLIIRSISDVAGSDQKISFEKFLPLAAEQATNLVLHMLQELKK